MRNTAALLAILLSVASAATAADLEFHFIAVGQGDSTLVVCPNGNRILVDAGAKPKPPAAETDAIRKYLRDHLRSLDRLEYLVVTHGDSDHYSLLPEVLAGVQVDSVMYGGELGDYPVDDFDDWLRGFQPNRLHRPPSQPDPPDKPNTHFDCGDADVWVVAANVDDKPEWKKNTGSVVLRFSYGEFEAVLTGDATYTTEQAIRKFYRESDETPWSWLESDLLKLGHHGSKTTSTARRWVRAVSPEVAVASAAGGSNWHGHPARSRFTRATSHTHAAPKHTIHWCDGQYNCWDEETYESIYTTGSSGTIVVASDGNGWRLTCTTTGGC